MIDIAALRYFYHRDIGHFIAPILFKKIAHRWKEFGDNADNTPHVPDKILLAHGYPHPYLPDDMAFHKKNVGFERIICSCPDYLGAVQWPHKHAVNAKAPSAINANMVCLTNDAHLPFPDMSVDNMLIVHSLEFTHHDNLLLDEAWRVLNGRGRLLLIVPNRLGFWARCDSVAFGMGRPFTYKQIKKSLSAHLFHISDVDAALHCPPQLIKLFPKKYTGKLFHYFDSILRLLLPKFGGVFIIECEKILHQPITVSKRAKAHKIFVPGSIPIAK